MPGTHPKPRKTAVYTEHQLQSALEACRAGMSYREASEEFSVPRSTIGDKLQGKSVAKVTTRGGSPVITKAVEDRFAEWVINMARYGFPRTPNQIMEAVKLYLDKSKIKVPEFAQSDNRPGKTWFAGFIRRHPQIKLGRAEKLEQSRAMACTQDSVYAWFDEFEFFLAENNISSEDQIYNCDESGFPLQAGSSMKVCCDKHVKRNFQITSSSKTSITTLQCICANGSVISPAVLFPGCNFNPEYAIGFPKNFFLGFTKNGWMETPQFYGWLTNHFVKQIPPQRPVVLLVDGHASHIDYHTSLFCKQNGILLFRLPPHTSHALQPTDRGFFGVFKSNFSKEVAKFTVEHPGMSITKRIFSTVFTKAYDASSRRDVVKSSFRVTGIWPVNRLNVDHNLFNPSKVYTEAPNADFSVSQVDCTISLPKSDIGKPTTPCQSTPSLNFSVVDVESESVQFQQDINIPSHQDVDIQSQQGSLVPPTVIPESIPSTTVYPIAPNETAVSLSNTIAPNGTTVTLPGGSKVAPPLQASTPASKLHPVQQALLDLEKGLGNKKHLYEKRFIEGYSVPEDCVYAAWKILHQNWLDIKEQIRMESFSSQSSLNEDVNPIINSILRYPTIQRNTKQRKKKEYPKHMTSEEALKILKMEEDEKRRAEMVKEARRQEKERRKEGKEVKKTSGKGKTKKSAGKKVVKKKKLVAESDREESNEKEIEVESLQRPRRSVKRKRFSLPESSSEEEEEEVEYDEDSSSSVDSEFEEGDYICGHCGVKFVENELWLQCDKCSTWFHIDCTNQKKKTSTEVGKLLEWKCAKCC